jgi:copper chaperone CopZ
MQNNNKQNNKECYIVYGMHCAACLATVQNTILIIGGAIAVAVGLATAGVSVLVSAIVGVVAAVGAFTAAILLEEPAIMSVKDAEEALAAAKQATADARWDNINAIDAAEAAQKRLEEAEKKAGITGEELNKQVENGTIAYEDMTDAQKEVYKAYLDNEKKQKELEESTKALTDAKKKETLASFDNQLALAKESGNYDDYKKSVIDAYKSGKISADEARTMIEKSMSEMSDASQQTFMKDLPKDLKDGLDPHKYESTATKLKKWFSNMWTDIKKTFSNVTNAIADGMDKAITSAMNWVMKKAIGIINGFISAINAAIGVINLIPGVSINKIAKLEVPKMAKGGVVNSATLAMFGEAGKEAVIPLENNTEWMNILADRINQRSNTPSKIVLMLDKKEFGWANINSINDITKQTGALQLSLA